MGRPRAHNEHTRQRLLAAAGRILVAEGSPALSVRRGTAEVGTTTRAIQPSPRESMTGDPVARCLWSALWTVPEPATGLAGPGPAVLSVHTQPEFVWSMSR
jgi:hypothetical protein